MVSNFSSFLPAAIGYKSITEIMVGYHFTLILFIKGSHLCFHQGPTHTRYFLCKHQFSDILLGSEGSGNCRFEYIYVRRSISYFRGLKCFTVITG